ncbi:hypothetical protein JW916_11430 [Candidatus Sumerlaeota bacterium]|nr:hypothetical protein [Candidatus Sumerlaeota bacterium]
MIRINLLPSELRGRRGRAKAAAAATAAGPPTPALGNFLVVAWLIVVIAVVGYLVNSNWKTYAAAKDKAQQARTAIQEREDKIRRQEEESRELLRLWDRLKIQEEILNSLMPENRLLWSEKLNMLARLLPEGVFITRLEVAEETKMVETERSKANRRDWESRQRANRSERGSGRSGSSSQEDKEPEKIMKPQIKQTLRLKAAAIGEDKNERFDRMLKFENALKVYEQENRKNQTRRFMDGFSELVYGDIDKDEILMQDAALDGVQVWEFDMELPTRVETPQE